jgi:hypothetical protein
MHDGLYGRSHLYSYVNDNGMWWKTVDWSVTEVSSLSSIQVHVLPSIIIGFGRDCFNRSDGVPP